MSPVARILLMRPALSHVRMLRLMTAATHHEEHWIAWQPTEYEREGCTRGLRPRALADRLKL